MRLICNKIAFGVVISLIVIFAGTTMSFAQCVGFDVTVIPAGVTCTGGAASGSISVTVTNGNPVYAYSWSNATTTGSGNSIENKFDISDLQAGTYSLTVIDGNTCSQTINTIVVAAAPPVNSLTLTEMHTTCGLANGKITLSNPTGGSGHTYEWSNGATTQIIMNLTGGETYTVTVTNSAGCTKTNSKLINLSTGVTVNVDSIRPVSCNGLSNGIIYLSVSGAGPTYSYSWVPNNIGSGTITRSNLSAGTYNVTVTSNTCSGSPGPITVTQPTILNLPTPSVTQPTCTAPTSGQATANPSGGTPLYTYLWSANASSQTTQTATGLSAGTYTVTVTDTRGCSATKTITLSVSGGLTVTATANNSCTSMNGNIIVSEVQNGISPYNISWSPSGNAMGVGIPPSFSTPLLSNGTYTVTVTSTGGCTGTKSVTISGPIGITGTSFAVTPLSCPGSNDGKAKVTPVGGSGYTYSWSNSQTTQEITGLSEGPYTVSVTSGNCPAIVVSTFVGTMPPMDLLIVDNVKDTICQGVNNGNLVIKVTGGTAPYSVDWYAPNGSFINPTGTQISMSSGSYTITSPGTAGSYNIIVTDNKNCTKSITGTIGTYPLMVITPSVTNVSCFGYQNGTFTASTTGDSPFSYVWSTGQTTSSNTISNLNPGTYTVTVTDNNGCTKSASTTVTGPTQQFTATLSGGGGYCQNSNGAINLMVNLTNAPGASYVFVLGNTSNSEIINSSTPTITVSPNQTTTYTLISAVAGGCPATLIQPLMATVEVQDSISFTISGDTTICSGSSMVLYTNLPASGGYNYQWKRGNTNVGNLDPLIISGMQQLNAGVYSLRVTSPGSGCFGRKKITVIVTNSPGATVISTPLSANYFCENESIQLTGSATPGSASSNTYSYLWSVNSTGNPLILNATENTEGIYFLTITDGNGCTSTGQSAYLNVITRPDAPSSYGDTAVCFTGNAAFNPPLSVNPGSYVVDWFSSATNPPNNFLMTGSSYSPTVSAIAGSPYKYYARTKIAQSGKVCYSTDATEVRLYIYSKPTKPSVAEVHGKYAVCEDKPAPVITLNGLNNSTGLWWYSIFNETPQEISNNFIPELNGNYFVRRQITYSNPDQTCLGDTVKFAFERYIDPVAGILQTQI